jgi:hypothetical protein
MICPTALRDVGSEHLTSTNEGFVLIQVMKSPIVRCVVEASGTHSLGRRQPVSGFDE